MLQSVDKVSMAASWIISLTGWISIAFRGISLLVSSSAIKATGADAPTAVFHGAIDIHPVRLFWWSSGHGWGMASYLSVLKGFSGEYSEGRRSVQNSTIFNTCNACWSGKWYITWPLSPATSCYRSYSTTACSRIERKSRYKPFSTTAWTKSNAVYSFSVQHAGLPQIFAWYS